jgi:diguanylate cyclase (GGDEF)-like protein/PAS domain S-box-containing protein
MRKVRPERSPSVPRRRSIRTKLTVAVLVAALSPLAIVALVSYNSQETIAVENAFERLEGIAAAQVGQLEGIVSADREIAEVLVTQTSIRHGLVSADLTQVEIALKVAVAEIDRLQSVLVIDMASNAVAASDASAVERVEAVRSRSTMDGSFEGVVVEGAGGEPVVLSATPVVVDGERVGFVIIETSLDAIAALATNYAGLSETGETSVAQLGPDGGAEFIAPLRFKDGAVLNLVIPASAAEAPITLAMAGEESRFDGVPDYRQKDVLAVTRSVEGPGWGVVVKIDRAEALSGLASFRNALMGALFVGALLVIVLATLFARWITRPIERVTNAAVAVASGDLDRRAHIRSRDEIGALAHAVATMADTLVDSAETETKRSSELEFVNAQLATSDARVRSIVDNAAEGIIACDRHGIIQRANEAAGSIVGLHPDFLTGNCFGTYFGMAAQTEDAFVPMRENILEWIYQQPQEVVGLYARHDDGRRVPIRLALSRVDQGGEVFYTALVRDVSESLEFERRLWESAHYDGLTGLPNRELFLAELDHALTEREAGTSTAVLFVDLDRFKAVNDAWGHAAGDQLLELVAVRLNNSLRDHDLLARFGGDEFVIMARGSGDLGELAELGRRIIRELESPFHLGEHTTYIGASVGLAMADSDDTSADDLVSQADVAMYGAKAGGRGRVLVFDAEMRERVQKHHVVHTELKRAIDEHQFEVHYQPIVALRSGEFVGAEALVRWNHPERGMIAPDEFIPVAEETGLVNSIGRIVLQSVARQIVGWSSRSGGSPRIAVNMSAREVMDPTIVQSVLGILEDAGAPPTRLTIEVTESVLMTDAQTAIENLGRLRAAGIQIALDDFGTGYSSLTYLRDMPVDIVKIDRRFISELSESGPEASIAAMVLGLGRTMGLVVVAEGVETSAQHARLLEVGGTYAQGYLYARPGPPEQIADLLWPSDRTVVASFNG